jgi:hypothetical protein
MGRRLPGLGGPAGWPGPRHSAMVDVTRPWVQRLSQVWKTMMGY